ncbi:hypothetical protein GpartN1_g1238.t1 [Galdieria partita]|uniref:Secreted protein n=1 Tax=Galdieria partita TaxID=83374 RepID=A0A9C7PTI7_9RHOD|nr:hypothetical protein GpartN1_g1238.t1 [Galdieria partita]
MKKAGLLLTVMCCSLLVVYTIDAASVSFSESFTQGNGAASGSASSSSSSETTTANSGAISAGQGTSSSMDIAKTGQYSSSSYSNSLTSGNGASFGSAAGANTWDNLITASSSEALSANNGEASSQASSKSSSQNVDGSNYQSSQITTNSQSNLFGSGLSQAESLTANTGDFGLSATTGNAYAQQYVAGYNYPYFGIAGLNSEIDAGTPGYGFTESSGYSNTNCPQGYNGYICSNSEVGSINSAYNGGISDSQAQSYFLQ